MINLRYHIVSITAVFLALGIGVALGGTFLDQATVDVLNRNIRSAEARIAETDSENRELEQQLREARERDDALIIVGTQYLLTDQLTDQPVLVVTAPGVEGDDVDALRTVLERSGADLQGTLALRDKLVLGDEVDDPLAAAVGLDDPTPVELRDAIHDALSDALLAAGSVGDGLAPDDGAATPEPGAGSGSGGDDPTSPNDAEGTAAPQADVVRVLLERDYLDFVPAADGERDDADVLVGTGHRYVFVGGPALTDEQNELLLGLLPDQETDGRLAATVASATQRTSPGDDPLSPTIVARVRSDDARTSLYNTVDELDTFAGLVAVVRTLVLMDTAAPDHYGQGDGASAVLPSGL